MREIECKSETSRIRGVLGFAAARTIRWGGINGSQAGSDCYRSEYASRLAAAIIVALGAPQTAIYAQEQAAPDLDEIIVTGSRLRTSGMDMPNPVTVVSREEVSIIAPTNLVEGLAELPQFYGSNTTQSPGNFFTTEGAGSLNLRGLQSKRTLQLLNGRRVVQSTIFGGPDINLFPESVISSVETVTGGASAAYGTDAVAGAVNFILDTDFEGIRANVSGGENDKGHGDHYEVSFGAGFALGDNTHVLVSLEKNDQDAIGGEQTLEYDWYRARALLENTAPGAGTTPDNPAYVPYDQIRNLSASLDGILYLPAAAGGTQILDANGNPSPFVLGSPCNTHGCSTVNGGSGVDNGVPGTTISPDTGRENLFAYLEHDFGDSLTVFGQIISGEAEVTQRGNAGLFPNPPGAAADRAFTIYSGNPFLPASIQQAMTANNLASVLFGRIGAPEDIGFDAFTEQTTETDSLTGGFEYDFQGDGFFGNGEWQLNGYYQTGETDVRAIQRGGIRLDRIYLASDVVTDPLNGQPACNVTVTTRGTANPLYPDCVPLNLFGRGRASPAAVDWSTGFETGVQINAQGFLSATESMPYSYVSGQDKQRVIQIEQDVWEISANGELAEGWAGPISMAFGYGFREESFTQVVEVGPGGNINADPRFRPVMANNAALGIRGVPGGALASGNSVEVQFSNVPFARGEQDVTGGLHRVPRPPRLRCEGCPTVESFRGRPLGRLFRRRKPGVVEDGVRLGHRRSSALARHGVGGCSGRNDGREVRPHGWVYGSTQRLRDRPDARAIYGHAVFQWHAGYQARASEHRDFRHRVSAEFDPELERFRRLLLRHHRGQHPAGWGPDGRHGLLPAKRPVPVLADHSRRHAEHRESLDQLHFADRRALLQPGTHRGQGHRLRGELSQGRRLVRRRRVHRHALLGQLSRRAHRYQCRGCEDPARGHVRCRTYAQRRPTGDVGRDLGKLQPRPVVVVAGGSLRELDDHSANLEHR